MAKATRENKEKKALLRLSMFGSLWEDPGRRALTIVLIILFLGIVLTLLVNLAYLLTPNSYRGSILSGLGKAQENSNRIFIPTGFLLILIGAVFFVMGEAYGEYTDISLGKKSVLAKPFFRRLGFYFALIGAAFLLSGGIVDTVSAYI